MVQTVSNPITLAEFLQQPDGTQMGWLIFPHERTVFIYRPKQEIEVFDDPDSVIPVPLFASEIRLTVKDLFYWLLK